MQTKTKTIKDDDHDDCDGVGDSDDVDGDRANVFQLSLLLLGGDKGGVATGET